jgi:hypothetical protein
MNGIYIAKSIVGAAGLLACAVVAFSPISNDMKISAILIVAGCTSVCVLFL